MALKILMFFWLIYTTAFGQTICFSDNNEVIKYLNGKTFESLDDFIEANFTNNRVFIKAGEFEYQYEIDSNFQLTGNKGVIVLLGAEDDVGLKFYIDCDKHIVDDKNGAILVEKQLKIFQSSLVDEKLIYSIENLQIMKKDLGKMTFKKAKKACSELKGGWRLPTRDEAYMLYKNKKKIGGFSDVSYWTSTLNDRGLIWKTYFGNGNQFHSDKYPENYVRAVRDIP